MQGCSAVVKRLPSHLRTHKILQNSQEYTELLAIARKQPTGNVMIRDSSGCLSPMSATNHGTEDIDMSNPGVQSESDTDDVETEVENKNRMEEESSEIEEQIRQFVSWMSSPDGGRKHDTSTKKHASQMYTVLSLAKQNQTRWWDRSVLDIFNKFATQKQYMPATKKSYLGSMKHFCKYALDTSAGPAGNENMIGKMHDRVTSWITAHRKECGKHQQQKMDRDLNKLVTPLDVTGFERSEAAVKAIKILGTSENSSQLLVQTDYVTVRDYLLAEVALKNANRSGVLANMMVSEFRAARVVEGQYVVSVAEHKTCTTYGAAKIVLSHSLYHYITIYCNNFRSQVISAGNNPPQLFLSWNGMPLASGQFTRTLQSIWQKAGLGNNITFNLVRKSAVSAIHETHPEMSSKLADLMSHRQATAQKCYRIVEREHSSVLASKQLAQTFSGQGQPVEFGEQLVSERTDKTNPEVQVLEDTIGAVQSSTSSSFQWTDMTIALVRNLFKDNIESRNISLGTVKCKIEENELLRDIGSRKVYDRIRAEIKSDMKSSQAVLPQQYDTLTNRVERMFSDRKKQTESIAITDEGENKESSESDYVPPSSRKDIFEKDELKVLVKLCATLIGGGPISKEKIGAELEKTAKGRHFLQSYTLFQLQNRLKYERRKKKTSC